MGGRLYQGLKLIVPRGMATLTLSRMAWLNADAAQWELWEFDQKTEELEQRDAADHGNLTTRLMHAPNESAARERFAESMARVMALVPEAMREVVEQRMRSGTEMAFLLHGLEFARVRMGYAGTQFNSVQEITFGAGANETPLTEENEASCGSWWRGCLRGAVRAGTNAIRSTGCSRSGGWRVCCGGMWSRSMRISSGACLYAGAGVCGGGSRDARPAGRDERWTAGGD